MLTFKFAHESSDMQGGISIIVGAMNIRPTPQQKLDRLELTVQCGITQGSGATGWFAHWLELLGQANDAFGQCSLLTLLHSRLATTINVVGVDRRLTLLLPLLYQSRER